MSVCVHTGSNFLSNYVDIDECSDPSLNNCHSSAVCINTMGNFTCECNPGFEGDGVNCTGEFCPTATLYEANATSLSSVLGSVGVLVTVGLSCSTVHVYYIGPTFLSKCFYELHKLHKHS